MPADHTILNTLTDAQVFTLLRHLPNVARQNRRPAGAGGQLPPPVDLSAAPPSADIARLLLHATAEDRDEAGKALHFILTNNGERLEQELAQPPTQPDTTGWHQAAAWMLQHLQNRLTIDWKDGRWKVECSPELLNLPEIRDWIASSAHRSQPVEIKNLVTGSSIKAGGNVHIGDNHYHLANVAPLPPPPRPVVPTFVKISALLLLLLISAIAVLLLRAKYDSQAAPGEDARKGETTLPAVPADTISLTIADTGKAQSAPPLPPPPVRKPRGEPMAGQITDEAGVPLPGVRISALGFEESAISDAHGQFRLYIYPVPPSREVRLSFIKEGYLPGDEIYPEIPKTDIKKQLRMKNQ